MPNKPREMEHPELPPIITRQLLQALGDLHAVQETQFGDSVMTLMLIGPDPTTPVFSAVVHVAPADPESVCHMQNLVRLGNGYLEASEEWAELVARYDPEKTIRP